MPGTLPYSEGRKFESLDSYLAYLRDKSTIGVPYYREVKPGQYERVGSIRLEGKATPTFSRAELEAKYGFPVSGR